MDQMERGSVMRARRSRETSPDRARVYVQQPRGKPFRKVQVIYYLCRNGQLEHPHFMEVTHLPNQHLRLKDVMDRLTVLRGRGMPALYSWSCKRSYKNGYVWNDLSENDVIYPAEGAEYILKGSEIIIEGCSTERFQHMNRARQLQPPHIMTPESKHMLHQQEEEEEDIGQMEEEEDLTEEIEEEEEDKVPRSHPHNTSSSSNTPNSRCSRGVSTEELDQQSQSRVVATEEMQDTTSPPSCSSSEQKASTAAVPAVFNKHSTSSNRGGSTRFDEIDSEPTPTRSPSSLLFQLITCGSVTAKGRTGNFLMRPPNNASSQAQIVNAGNGNSGRKSGVSLHRGVLCRLAATRAVADDDDEDDENVIRYMSENPRFGNPQLEDKEYFSGSIVEAITNEARSEPSLKKSSSYNEERSSKCGLGGDEVETMEDEERSVKGRCIPSRRKAAAKK